MHRTLIAVSTVLSLAAAVPAAAQRPNAAVTQNILPSPEDVLGYGIGEEFTDPATVLRYFETLAAAAPQQVRIRPYGESVEGRPLVQVVIARADRLAQLDAILASNRELTQVTTSEARAREIASTNPAVIYFSYGVHGNESSSSEAAMWTAWDILRGAAPLENALDRAVVIIDPVVNPDGRQRYVDFYKQARGARANPDPDAREHSEPWPGGRFNHYLFDLNRDWAWQTQVETRARLATWAHWSPQVHVDFHEMSPNSSYFFFPAAEPFNPLYPPHIRKWGELFGDANAAAFDAEGWPYYTAESYDLFYPGYGDTWPSLLGAIGMTYEQAGSGSAGLAFERADGQILTLTDRAQHHRTTGNATLALAAQRSGELLQDYAAFFRTVGSDQPDILLVPGPDEGRMRALLDLLHTQGIRVERAGAAFRAGADPHPGFANRSGFPAGTYRVPARQTRGLLAATLLVPEVVLDATFSYDVSAWSLPFAYGVEAHSVRTVPAADWQVVSATSPQHATVGANPPYGFLLSPGFESWQAAARFVDAGGRAVALDEGFAIDGREWPAGTLFLPRAGTADFAAAIAEARLPVSAVPVRTGRVTRGNDLGTEESYTIRARRVGLLGGPGVSATSFGAHWFFLENTLPLHHTVLVANQLQSVDLAEYDVIIAPDMSGSALTESGRTALKTWVEGGGTLVAVADAARGIGATIADVKVREASPDTTGNAVERALRGRAARELEEWESQVPGTILPARLDPAHPLAFGAGATGDSTRLYVLYSGGQLFEPDAAFETVAHFGADVTKVSGVIADRALTALQQGSWLATKDVGAGTVILFADDPLFRHFWYSTFQIFANAVLLGPAM